MIIEALTHHFEHGEFYHEGRRIYFDISEPQPAKPGIMGRGRWSSTPKLLRLWYSYTGGGAFNGLGTITDEGKTIQLLLQTTKGIKTATYNVSTHEYQISDPELLPKLEQLLLTRSAESEIARNEVTYLANRARRTRRLQNK